MQRPEIQANQGVGTPGGWGSGDSAGSASEAPAGDLCELGFSHVEEGEMTPLSRGGCWMDEDRCEHVL